MINYNNSFGGHYDSLFAKRFDIVKLLSVVGLVNLCIGKKRFIFGCHCILKCDFHDAFVATISFHEFKLLVACVIYFTGAILNMKGVWRLPIDISTVSLHWRVIVGVAYLVETQLVL